MKIKNNSKRLIVLNFKDGKTWGHVQIPSGVTVDEPKFKESDVAHFVKEGSLEIVVDKKEDVLEPIVLIEPVTPESLEALTVDELKQYCKENKIKPYAKLLEAELIEKILASLVPAE